jgi:hypothetical protein
VYSGFWQSGIPILPEPGWDESGMRVE